MSGCAGIGGTALVPTGGMLSSDGSATVSQAAGQDTNNTAENSQTAATAGSLSYPIVDTNQGVCYDSRGAVGDCPQEGSELFGQDAQYSGSQPSYTDNGDGTVTDNVTGLMWQQSPDLDGDGNIDADDKLSYDDALARCAEFLAGRLR